MNLSPRALREIASWLDLSDQYIRATIDFLGDSEDAQYIRRRLTGSEMQTDIRRWADEMELDS